MVAENFTNNFEAGDKRNNVVALLENIDFVKKNPEISDSGELKRRAEIALKFLEDPEKFKTNIFNKKEQIAFVKTEKYLHKIINSSSQKESSSKDGNSEAKKMAQAAEKMSMAAEKMAQAAGKQTERPSRKKNGDEEDSDKTFRTRSGTEFQYGRFPETFEEQKRFVEERLNFIEKYDCDIVFVPMELKNSSSDDRWLLNKIINK